MLKRPINDKIAKAVHNSNPLSWMYPGICAETKVILNPHTKKPKVKSMKPRWLNASFNASGIVCSAVLILALTILSFLTGIVLILFLVLPTSTYVALGFGMLYGYLWLSTIPPTNGIISQVFGTKYLAMLYGVVFFSHQIGSFFGAYLGGYFFDQYGSYDYAWYLSIALSFFATVVHLPIDEKPLPRLATT